VGKDTHSALMIRHINLIRSLTNVIKMNIYDTKSTVIDQSYNIV
jgi:hypothetical protein